MSLYIAAYDIQDNNRRRQVARVLRQYGHRVQESVFEVWLETPDLPEFRRSIGPLLSGSDLFDLYPVDLHPGRKRLRWQQPPDSYKPVIEI